MTAEPENDDGPGEASEILVRQTTDLFNPAYVGDVYRLSFENGLVAKVPRPVIRRYPSFAALFVDRQLDIPAMNERGARIFVYYLYTGIYQSPEPEARSPEEKRRKAFAIGLLVYFAGVECKLEQLAALASVELTKLGEDLTFVDILNIMDQEEFDVREDNAWLVAYMVYRAKRLEREPVTRAQVLSLWARIRVKRSLVSVLIETIMELKLEVQSQRNLLRNGRGQC